MARLQGKVALITGGTSGIGAATARLFQAEGATVIVTGSNPTTLEAARRELAGIEVVASDIADIYRSRTMIRQLRDRHGRLDILFANAGIAKFAASSEVDAAHFDLQFAINVRGAYFAIKHAAEVMEEGGAIILNASVSGAMGGAGQTVYSATKAALRSFGRTFAAELAPRRIRVNTISPGPIDTPIAGKLGLPPEQVSAMIEGFVAGIPLARSGRADEVAAAALFFAADATYTTGGELFVDGGLIDV